MWTQGFWTFSLNLATNTRPLRSQQDCHTLALSQMGHSVSLSQITHVGELTRPVVLCYQFLYIQPNGRLPPKDPWSLRQVGVYHRYSTADCRSFSILLHPESTAVAQTRLETIVEQSSNRQLLQEHPLNVHLIILSSYTNFWQAYIEQLARKVGHIVLLPIRKRDLGVKHC